MSVTDQRRLELDELFDQAVETAYVDWVGDTRGLPLPVFMRRALRSASLDFCVVCTYKRKVAVAESGRVEGRGRAPGARGLECNQQAPRGSWSGQDSPHIVGDRSRMTTIEHGSVYVRPSGPTLMTVRADELEKGDILDEGMACQHKEVYKTDRPVRWLVGLCPAHPHKHNLHLRMMEWEPDAMVKVLRPPKWTELGVVDSVGPLVVNTPHVPGLGS